MFSVIHDLIFAVFYMFKETVSLYTSELIRYGLATNHGAVANVLLKFQLDIQTDYLNKKL